MSANKGKALIFSAPSGSGKSSIVHALLKDYSQFRFSISATTRSPRGAEKHGSDYYFLSSEEFKTHIDKKDFIEYEEVYKDRFYGTLKSEVDKIWAQGNVVLFDVDVKGGIRLKNYFGENALSFFIKAPSPEILRQRLVSRNTDTPEEIERRIAKSDYESTFQNQFDYVIINDIFDVALNEIRIKIDDFLDR